MLALASVKVVERAVGTGVWTPVRTICRCSVLVPKPGACPSLDRVRRREYNEGRPKKALGKLTPAAYTK